VNRRDKYLELASPRYHQQFTDSKNADQWAVNAGKTYLTDHGLDPRMRCNDGQWLVKKYELGVVVNPMPGDERFEGWLSIPYLTRRGVKAIRFRNLKDDGGPKIGQAKGQASRLYNPEALFGPHLSIGIAEGEIDAVAATEGLVLPSVGVPGATQWAAHHRMWAPLFKDFERVYVLRDGDKAGKDLADAITETLGFKVRVIEMPNDEDVSSMLVQGRASELTRHFKENDEDDKWPS
jgi:Toprim-like